LLVDSLCVAEVAGVVVRDADWERMAGCQRLEFGEDFGDVAALCREGSGAFGPLRIVAEEVAVVLHRGTTAGGVDDDGVDVGLLEEFDDAAGHGGGLIVESGVDHQRPAARLIARRDYFAAFGGEDAGGGFVDVGEEDLLDASGEHAGSSAGCGGSHRIW